MTRRLPRLVKAQPQLGELDVVDDPVRGQANGAAKALHRLLAVAAAEVAPGQRLLQFGAVHVGPSQPLEVAGGIGKVTESNGQVSEGLPQQDVVGIASATCSR